jgi:hypothetical protein
MRIRFFAVAVTTLVLGMLATAGAQTIPEIARTKPKNPIVAGVLQDITTLPLETLAKEAPLIVVARLQKTRSYLTANEKHVLSDFSFQTEQVVAGQLPPLPSVPGPSVVPTLTVYGGTVTVDGEAVSAVDHNMDFPRSGPRYLLFLRPYGTEAGKYALVHDAIFEINGRNLRALLKVADSPRPYADVTSRTSSDVIDAVIRLRAAK